MIHKHEIPILEFDDNPQAVIMPTHEGLDLHLPEKCVYAFLEDEIDRFAEAVGAKQVASFVSATKIYIEENAFLIPTKALRDEGVSYHYVAPSRYIEVDGRALTAIEAVLKQASIPYQEVMTWSTDGFYRETPDKVAYRIEEGCSVVEMECASLAAVAQLREAVWGLLLFTADSLADLEHYDQRDWGSEAFEKALELCLEMVHHL